MDGVGGRSAAVPLRGVIRQLRSWWWVPLAGAVIGLAAAFVVTEQDSSSTATSRIGLTAEVRWPYYDATRSRVVGRFDDTLRQAVVADVPGGGSVTEVRVEMPPEQAYVDVVATGPDPAVAAAVSDAVAARLVQLDHDALVQGADDELAQAQSMLADAQARTEALGTQIQDLITQRSAAEAAGDDATYAELDDQIRALQIERDQELWSRSPLLENEINARLADQRDIDEAELLTAATVASERASHRPVQLAVGTAVGGVLGLLGAWAASGRWGRVRDPRVAARLLDVPVEIAAGPDGPQRAEVFLADLGRDATGVGTIAGRDDHLQVLALVHAAQRVEHPEGLGVKVPELVPLGAPDEPLAIERALLVHPHVAVVLVVDHHRARLQALRAALGGVRDLEGRRVGVLVLGPRH